MGAMPSKIKQTFQVIPIVSKLREKPYESETLSFYSSDFPIRYTSYLPITTSYDLKRLEIEFGFGNNVCLDSQKEQHFKVFSYHIFSHFQKGEYIGLLFLPL